VEPPVTPMPLRLRLCGTSARARETFAATLIDLGRDGLHCWGELPSVPPGTAVTAEFRVRVWWGHRWLGVPAVVRQVEGRGSRWALEFRTEHDTPEAHRLDAVLKRAWQTNRKFQDVQGDGSPLAEAFHLVSQSFSSRPQAGARVIAVSSAVPLEGKSFVASGLAVVLAREGHRVLAVDAHLGRASLHAIFHVDREPGIVDLLSESQACPGRTGADAVARVTQPAANGVDIVAAGTSDTQSMGRYTPASVARLMEALRCSGYDEVIVDCPPLLTDSGANLLAAAADDVILTVRSGYSRERHLKEARALLDRNRARLSGVILNDHADFLHGPSSFRRRAHRAAPGLFSRLKATDGRMIFGALGILPGQRTIPIAPSETGNSGRR